MSRIMIAVVTVFAITSTPSLSFALQSNLAANSIRANQTRKPEPVLKPRPTIAIRVADDPIEKTIEIPSHQLFAFQAAIDMEQIKPFRLRGVRISSGLFQTRLQSFPDSVAICQQAKSLIEKGHLSDAFAKSMAARAISFEANIDPDRIVVFAETEDIAQAVAEFIIRMHNEAQLKLTKSLVSDYRKRLSTNLNEAKTKQKAYRQELEEMGPRPTILTEVQKNLIKTQRIETALRLQAKRARMKYLSDTGLGKEATITKADIIELETLTTAINEAIKQSDAISGGAPSDFETMRRQLDALNASIAKNDEVYDSVQRSLDNYPLIKPTNNEIIVSPITWVSPAGKAATTVK